MLQFYSTTDLDLQYPLRHVKPSGKVSVKTTEHDSKHRVNNNNMQKKKKNPTRILKFRHCFKMQKSARDESVSIPWQ